MKNILFILLLASCTKQNIVPSHEKTAVETVQAVSFIDTPLNIICAGNSLTVGYHLPDPDSAYPMQLASLLPGDLVQNKGVNGITTEQMMPLITTDITPNYDSTKKNIVIAWEIGNDIFWDGTTAKQAYDSFVVYCNAVRAHGWRVYALTLPARNNYYMGYPITPGGDDSTAYTAKIKSVNTMLRNHWPSFSDGLVDVAADKAFKKYSPTYYLSDHCHITAAGYTVVATLVHNSLIN